MAIVKSMDIDELDAPSGLGGKSRWLLASWLIVGSLAILFLGLFQTTYEIRVLRVEATGTFDKLTEFVTQIKEATVPTVVINKLDLSQEDESAALSMELWLYTTPLSAGGVEVNDGMNGTTVPLLVATETTETVPESSAPPEEPVSVPAATPTPASPPVCDCSANLYNCSNFSGPQDAQLCYDYCKQVTGGDVHLLDADLNGVVCESVWPGWNR